MDTLQYNTTELTLLKQRGPIVYGGFIKAEFARDVEMQSAEFITSQENIAAFINTAYNSKGLVRDWGKPVCLASTAHHDAAIPNITQEIYLTNVEWYIRVLKPHCEYIIWLGATAPADVIPGEYPQTLNLTRDWNTGVRELLERKTDLNAVFVDIFVASQQDGAHRPDDNLHLAYAWYSAMASFFWSVMSTKC
jgi:hypothetical protein